MKTKVAMMFGGKTVEHEVSVISGIQAFKAMDTDKYEVIPVYLTKENDMYIGSDIGNIKAYRDIPALLKKSQKVIMANDGGRVKLIPYPPKVFGTKPVEIAAVLNKDKSTISSIRTRLCKKVLGREGSGKDWDEFVLSL